MDDILELLTSNEAELMTIPSDESVFVECLIDPSLFRTIDAKIRQLSPPGTVEVLDLAVTADGSDAPQAPAVEAPTASQTGSSSAEGSNDTAVVVAAAVAAEQATVTHRLTCNKCNASFHDRAEQRDHFRSNWHRLNLKRKMKGQEILGFDEFSALTDEDVQMALLEYE